MPVSALLLRFAEGADVQVGRRALRAFRNLVVDLVEAALVEGVLAEKVHRGQVQCAPASRASPRLKHSRLGAQVGDFLSLGFGFRAVALDQTTVLYSSGCEKRGIFPIQVKA